MKCPNCNRRSVCGCNSCKGRRKYPRLRSTRLSRNSDNDWEQCPYCREKINPNILLDKEWEEMRQLKQIEQ